MNNRIKTSKNVLIYNLYILIILLLSIFPLALVDSASADKIYQYKGYLYFDDNAVPVTLKTEFFTEGESIEETTCDKQKSTISFYKSFNSLDFGGITLTDAEISGSAISESWSELGTGNSVKSISTQRTTIKGTYNSDTVKLITIINKKITFISEELEYDTLTQTYDAEISVKIDGIGVNTGSDSESFSQVISWAKITNTSEEIVSCKDRNQYECIKISVTYGGWDWDYDVYSSGSISIKSTTSSYHDVIWIRKADDVMVKTMEYDEHENLLAEYSIYSPSNDQFLTIIIVGGLFSLISLGFIFWWVKLKQK